MSAQGSRRASVRYDGAQYRAFHTFRLRGCPTDNIHRRKLLQDGTRFVARSVGGKAEGAEDGDPEGGEDVDDDLYQDAIRVVCDAGRASTSTLQRRLRIGYGRAARLIDLMEKDGIVGPPDGTKPREVLKNRNWMKEYDDSAH